MELEELTFNGLSFKDKFVEEVLIPTIPESFAKFWEIDFSPRVGCIRVDENEVKTIYLFTPIKGYETGVLRFVRTDLGWDFHSIYTNFDFEDINEYSEYRYDLEFNLLSTYKFIELHGDNEYQSHQYKNGKLTKKYKFEVGAKPADELEIAIREGILNEFNVKNIKIDKDSIKDNPNQNYYYIR